MRVMSDLTLDDSAARSAQAALHTLSGDVGLDLRHGVPDTGSARFGTALESWLCWQAQRTGALSASIWAEGDAVRRSSDAFGDADDRLASGLRGAHRVLVAE
jgi:hypothetical protein